MQNRIRQLREKKGLTQAELADAVGTSQQQIQRIESGSQAVKLLLATQVAAALEVDLMVLFPDTAKAVKKTVRSGKGAAKEAVMDSDTREVEEAGLDIEGLLWFISIRMLSGLKRVYKISAAEAERLRLNLAHIGEIDPFFVFSSRDRIIALNLLQVAAIHELYQPYDQDWEQDERPEEDVVVYFSGSKEPEVFMMEPSEESAGDFDLLLAGLQTFVEPTDFIDFEDTEGETVFLKSSNIALIDAADWTTDASLYPMS